MPKIIKNKKRIKYLFEEAKWQEFDDNTWVVRVDHVATGPLGYAQFLKKLIIKLLNKNGAMATRCVLDTKCLYIDKNIFQLLADHLHIEIAHKASPLTKDQRRSVNDTLSKQTSLSDDQLKILDDLSKLQWYAIDKTTWSAAGNIEKIADIRDDEDSETDRKQESTNSQMCSVFNKAIKILTFHGMIFAKTDRMDCNRYKGNILRVNKNLLYKVLSAFKLKIKKPAPKTSPERTNTSQKKIKTRTPKGNVKNQKISHINYLRKLAALPTWTYEDAYICTTVIPPHIHPLRSIQGFNTLLRYLRNNPQTSATFCNDQSKMMRIKNNLYVNVSLFLKVLAHYNITDFKEENLGPKPDVPRPDNPDNVESSSELMDVTQVYTGPKTYYLPKDARELMSAAHFYYIVEPLDRTEKIFVGTVAALNSLGNDHVQFGLFAAGNPPSETQKPVFMPLDIIGVYGGREVSLKNANPDYAFQITENSTNCVDPSKHGGMARFINHSFSPNAKIEAVEQNGRTVLRVLAKRKIWPWEQITYDYGPYYQHRDHLVFLNEQHTCHGIGDLYERHKHLYINPTEDQKQLLSTFVKFTNYRIPTVLAAMLNNPESLEEKLRDLPEYLINLPIIGFMDEGDQPLAELAQTHITILMIAAGLGNQFAVRELLFANADPNRQSSSGETALYYAIENHHRHRSTVTSIIIDEIINAGGTQSIYNAKRETPLHLIVNLHDLPLANTFARRFLCKNPDYASHLKLMFQSHTDPLLLALKNGYIDMFKLLFEAVLTNVTTENNYTVLNTLGWLEDNKPSFDETIRTAPIETLELFVDFCVEKDLFEDTELPIGLEEVLTDRCSHAAENNSNLVNLIRRLQQLQLNESETHASKRPSTPNSKDVTAVPAALQPMTHDNVTNPKHIENEPAMNPFYNAVLNYINNEITLATLTAAISSVFSLTAIVSNPNDAKRLLEAISNLNNTTSKNNDDLRQLAKFHTQLTATAETHVNKLAQTATDHPSALACRTAADACAFVSKLYELAVGVSTAEDGKQRMGYFRCSWEFACHIDPILDDEISDDQLVVGLTAIGNLVNDPCFSLSKYDTSHNIFDNVLYLLSLADKLYNNKNNLDFAKVLYEKCLEFISNTKDLQIRGGKYEIKTSPIYGGIGDVLYAKVPAFSKTNMQVPATNELLKSAIKYFATALRLVDDNNQSNIKNEVYDLHKSLFTVIERYYLENGHGNVKLSTRVKLAFRVLLTHFINTEAYAHIFDDEFLTVIANANTFHQAIEYFYTCVNTKELANFKRKINQQHSKKSKIRYIFLNSIRMQSEPNRKKRKIDSDEITDEDTSPNKRTKISSDTPVSEPESHDIVMIDEPATTKTRDNDINNETHITPVAEAAPITSVNPESDNIDSEDMPPVATETATSPVNTAPSFKLHVYFDKRNYQPLSATPNLINTYDEEILAQLLQCSPNNAECSYMILTCNDTDNATDSLKMILEDIIEQSITNDTNVAFTIKLQDYFLSGMINGNKLMLMDPHGIYEQSSYYPVLSALMQEGKLKQIWFSNDKLLNGDKNIELVSSGQISTSMLIYIISYLTPERIHQFWQQLKTTTPTFDHDSELKYYAINLNDMGLLPVELSGLLHLSGNRYYDAIAELQMKYERLLQMNATYQGQAYDSPNPPEATDAHDDEPEEDQSYPLSPQPIGKGPIQQLLPNSVVPSKYTNGYFPYPDDPSDEDDDNSDDDDFAPSVGAMPIARRRALAKVRAKARAKDRNSNPYRMTRSRTNLFKPTESDQDELSAEEQYYPVLVQPQPEAQTLGGKRPFLFNPANLASNKPITIQPPQNNFSVANPGLARTGYTTVRQHGIFATARAASMAAQPEPPSAGSSVESAPQSPNVNV